MNKLTTKQKVLSHLKWFLAIIPVGIFSALTAPILYPLALFFEGVNSDWNPLWFYLDDEIESSDTNTDWVIYCKGDVDNFKYLYTWHAFRNTCWNLKSKIKPKVGRLHCRWNAEQVEEVLVDNLFRNGKKVDTGLPCLEMAAYKWIDKDGLEGWNVNRGVKVSKKYSTTGKSVLWYSVDGSLYYRLSIAKELRIFWQTYYFSFKMGASEKRYLLTFKMQKA